MAKVEIEVDDVGLPALLAAAEATGGRVRKVTNRPKSDVVLAKEEGRLAWREEAQAHIVNSIERGLPGSDEVFGLQTYARVIMQRWLSPLPRKFVSHLWSITENTQQDIDLGAQVPTATAEEIAHESRDNSNKVSSTLRRVVDMGIVKAVPHPTSRKLQYSIADRFLASGLLLNSNPQEWRRRFDNGRIHDELGVRVPA